MKKLFALILALAYLSASSGMVLNVQYCFNQVSSVQVNGFGEDNCCCNGTKNKAGCCSNEVKVVKLQDTHHAAFANYSIDHPIQLFPVPLSFLQPVLTVPVGENFIYSSDNSPPDKSAPSIYIKNCVFRI